MGKAMRIEFRIDADLRDKFYAAAKRRRQPAAQVLRELMQDYVEAPDEKRQADNDAGTAVKSRLSSNKLEDIEWRVREARASARIEGIEPDPEYEEFFAKLRAEGVSESDIRKRFIAMIKR